MKPFYLRMPQRSSPLLYECADGWLWNEGTEHQLAFIPYHDELAAYSRDIYLGMLWDDMNFILQKITPMAAIDYSIFVAMHRCFDIW